MSQNFFILQRSNWSIWHLSPSYTYFIPSTQNMKVKVFHCENNKCLPRTFHVKMNARRYWTARKMMITFCVQQKLRQNFKTVTWRDHAHFRDSLSSVGWDQRVAQNKNFPFCVKIVKILVLIHPLGDLRVTHRFYLWLDGKRIVNFLLVITELFG